MSLRKAERDAESGWAYCEALKARLTEAERALREIKQLAATWDDGDHDAADLEAALGDWLRRKDTLPSKPDPALFRGFPTDSEGLTDDERQRKDAAALVGGDEPAGEA